MESGEGDKEDGEEEGKKKKKRDTKSKKADKVYMPAVLRTVCCVSI